MVMATETMKLVTDIKEVLDTRNNKKTENPTAASQKTSSVTNPPLNTTNLDEIQNQAVPTMKKIASTHLHTPDPKI